MAASRRAWQTAARTDDPGEPAGGGEGHESSDPATTRPSMPEEENSNSAEDPMPPDPWTEWILRHREFEGHPPRRREGHLPGSFGVYRPPRNESGSGYDSSWSRRNSNGWLSDGELRNFNVAQVRHITAMNNGKWAGSYDEARRDREWLMQEMDGGRDLKPTEKISVPEFGGDGANDSEVGKSARSYVRKVQVWLRCTRLPPSQRALAL